MIENLELKLSGREPVTKKELFILVSSWGRKESFLTNDNIEIEECKPKERYPLENLDVSQITDFSFIFRYSHYNGNLSKWNMSNATTLEYMFLYSEFNNDSLKDWNTSNVTNMELLFYKSNFNGDISNWNISNCLNMESIFDSCPFDGDISKWEFNEQSYCYEIVANNDNFIDKYNNSKNIPNDSNEFKIWFEENREKIRKFNSSKEEILNFFSFDLNKEINL